MINRHALQNFEPVLEDGKSYWYEKVGPEPPAGSVLSDEPFELEECERFITPDGNGWIVNKKFKLGDELLFANGKVYTVVGIEMVERQTPEEVVTMLSLAETKTIWRDQWHEKYQLEEKK
jgi:hypothetical protein